MFLSRKLILYKFQTKILNSLPLRLHVACVRLIFRDTNVNFSNEVTGTPHYNIAIIYSSVDKACIPL